MLKENESSSFHTSIAELCFLEHTGGYTPENKAGVRISVSCFPVSSAAAHVFPPVLFLSDKSTFSHRTDISAEKCCPAYVSVFMSFQIIHLNIYLKETN